MAIPDRSVCRNCGLDFPHLPETQTEEDHDEFYPHWCGLCRACCSCMDDEDDELWGPLEGNGMPLWHMALLLITMPVWAPALWIYGKYLEHIDKR